MDDGGFSKVTNPRWTTNEACSVKRTVLLWQYQEGGRRQRPLSAVGAQVVGAAENLNASWIDKISEIHKEV